MKQAGVSLRSRTLWKCLVFLCSITTPALMLSTAASAADGEEMIETSCRNGDLVRRVVVVERSLSSGLSCEVVYWKDTEQPGARQVLWTARMDAGFCYSKAFTMVGKLASMGWTCNSVSQDIGLPEN